MSSAPKYQPHYTVDDYQLWEGDWELWNGTAVAMTPSPFGRHASALARLISSFSVAIDESECVARALPEIDWVLSSDTVVRPDMSVICGEVPERHIVTTPALVVEILSESTRQRDQTFKKDLYQQNRVPWYLIVDADEQVLQALRLDDAGQYQEVTHADPLNVDICETCQLAVKVDRLFD